MRAILVPILLICVLLAESASAQLVKIKKPDEKAKAQQVTRCPYCRDDVSMSDPKCYHCPDCKAPMHQECRDELGRCPVMGCVPKEVETTEPIRVQVGEEMQNPDDYPQTVESFLADIRYELEQGRSISSSRHELARVLLDREHFADVVDILSSNRGLYRTGDSEALGHIYRTIRALEASTDPSNQSAMFTLLDSIEYFGDYEWSILLTLLRHESPYVRKEAIESVSSHYSFNATFWDFAPRLLRDRDALVRQSAQQAVAKALSNRSSQLAELPIDVSDLLSMNQSGALPLNTEILEKLKRLQKWRAMLNETEPSISESNVDLVIMRAKNTLGRGEALSEDLEKDLVLLLSSQKIEVRRTALELLSRASKTQNLRPSNVTRLVRELSRDRWDSWRFHAPSLDVLTSILLAQPLTEEAEFLLARSLEFVDTARNRNVQAGQASEQAIALSILASSVELWPKKPLRDVTLETVGAYADIPEAIKILSLHKRAWTPKVWEHVYQGIRPGTGHGNKLVEALAGTTQFESRFWERFNMNLDPRQSARTLTTTLKAIEQARNWPVNIWDRVARLMRVRNAEVRAQVRQTVKSALENPEVSLAGVSREALLNIRQNLPLDYEQATRRIDQHLKLGFLDCWISDAGRPL